MNEKVSKAFDPFSKQALVAVVTAVLVWVASDFLRGNDYASFKNKALEMNYIDPFEQNVTNKLSDIFSQLKVISNTQNDLKEQSKTFVNELNHFRRDELAPFKKEMYDRITRLESSVYDTK